MPRLKDDMDLLSEKTKKQIRKGRRVRVSGTDPGCVISIVTVLLFLLAACRGYLVSDEVAIHTAVSAGYTSPRITDRHNIAPGFWGCGEGDAVGFEVDAKNPNGQPVHILVCAGWLFKSATVRIP